MRAQYDFAHGRRNPYAKRLNERVTIHLDPSTASYFKQLADESGIAFHTLINLYLRDCAESRRRLTPPWRPEGAPSEDGRRGS